MGRQLRIGFVPLIDAASILAAKERGFFDDEGPDVSLHRQVGWANIRDKITTGPALRGDAKPSASTTLGPRDSTQG